MKFLQSILISFLTLITVLEAKVNEEGGFINPVHSTQTQFENLDSTNTPSIEDAYRDIFGSNVYHVSQQSMSVLLPYAEMKGMVRRSMSIDRIGEMSSPNLYLSRGSNVYASNPENDVRWLEAQRYWLACFIDNYDQIRTLWNINNAYTVAMARSFSRLYDRVFIAAALGSASTGARSNTGTAVKLPDTQKFAAVGEGATAGTRELTGLNIETLDNVLRRMKKTFAVQRGEMAVLAITADEVSSLLKDMRVTSRDFTNVQPLLSGQVTTYYGFVFAQTELIPSNDVAEKYNLTTGKFDTSGTATTVGGFNRCFAFTGGSAICFGINQNILSRISERSDKHYNHQLYYASEFGAVRREEVKVVEVLCKKLG